MTFAPFFLSHISLSIGIIDISSFLLYFNSQSFTHPNLRLHRQSVTSPRMIPNSHTKPSYSVPSAYLLHPPTCLLHFIFTQTDLVQTYLIFPYKTPQHGAFSTKAIFVTYTVHSHSQSMDLTTPLNSKHRQKSSRLCSSAPLSPSIHFHLDSQYVLDFLLGASLP